MNLVDVNTESELGLERGSAAICIPVFGAIDQFAQCLRSVVQTTPESTRILIADDASIDPAIRALVEDVAAASAHQHVVYYLRQPENLGFVANVNAALDLLAPADVIVLNSDCVVPDRWFERLSAAAYSDTRVATASTLSNNGTILSVPHRNRPMAALPQEWTLTEAAKRVADASPRLRPEIPTTVGHCMYLKRAALDLVGGFDVAFSPGYGEEVDFSQRCVAHGLSHVVADDVLVLHYGSASFQPEGRENAVQRAHHEIIRSRYRYYDEMVTATAAAEDSPLARSLEVAARSLLGTSVTIDARILGPIITGTQVHALEVITAVHATAAVKLRIVLPANAGDYARALLTDLPGVELLVGDHLPADLEPTDVVHRPFQISSEHDVEFLGRLGRRIVITHQDLIAFHNPTYFASFDDWDSHRSLTRRALEAADRVLFFSRHAAHEAVADELVTTDRAQVIYIGTDHRLAQLRPAPAQPDGSRSLEGRPFMLCIGTDFKHKNRVFALRVLRALREEQGWDGCLVFAGPHITRGGSAGTEASFLARHPELEEHVIDLPAIDEPGKLWLLDHANSVLYPSTYEGFGLVPYEAAAVGIPCIFAAQTSVAELLPAELATIVPWDEHATAIRAIRVLRDGPERDAHVAGLVATAARLTWARTGMALVDAYRDVARLPARHARELVLEGIDAKRRLEAATKTEARLTAELAEMTLHADRLQHRINQNLDRLSPTDRALVEPGGAIPEDVRRPLLAIGSRRHLRAVVFGPLRLAYRLGHRSKPRPELPSTTED